MKKIKLSIKRQIQIAILLISICALLIFASVLFVAYNQNIYANYYSDFSYNLKSNDAEISGEIQHVISDMRLLLTDASFMQAIRPSEGRNKSYFGAAESGVVEDRLAKIALRYNYVQEIIVISRDGRIQIHSKLANLDKYHSLYEEAQEPDSIVWAQDALSKNGYETTYGNNIITRDQQNISIVKSMNRPEDFQSQGYLVAVLSKSLFETGLSNNIRFGTNNRTMVLDQKLDRPLIYYSGREDEEAEALDVYEEPKKHKDYISCQYQSDISGWTYISQIRKADLTRQGNLVASLIIFMLLGLGLGSACLSKWIAEGINRPIARLERLMESVGEEVVPVTAEFDQSEIGILGQKYKDLINNNVLLQQKLLKGEVRSRENQLRILQEQINPHFLYNTLDALYCLAEIEGVESIAKVVEALADVFRMTLNRGEKMISVEDELRHIHAYMVIQNMRFGDRFTFHQEMNLPEGWEKYRILKLILEPFVENAVTHGIEPKIGGGNIWLHGEQQGRYLFLEIQDDGVGVENIQEMRKGFAITNVKERMQLFYGDEGSIEISSKRNEGTRVKIRVPVWREYDTPISTF